MRTFKLVRVMMGSGWPSGHIAIDHYQTYPDKPGGTEMCLNGDTENAEELLGEIDGLIAELLAIRSEVPARFEQWKIEHDRQRNSRGRRI